MVSQWQGLSCQLGLVLTFDDILLENHPNGDYFTIRFTITQQRPLNTQNIIIKICNLNNIIFYTKMLIIDYFQ